ncbi:hypothetical protein Anapl_16100 [Anas platyrhynchos]|uniref:Uncharacterized protein n=1 Tax=Anas platyrhynchos TaxID=8839 RepID=R0JNF5_ANAPL|nr:hypothetical protein Anapl_16100 [Anas platyrhynchos]
MLLKRKALSVQNRRLQLQQWKPYMYVPGFPDLNCVGCTWLQLTDSRGASTLRWYHSQSGSRWVPAQEEGFSESLHSGAVPLFVSVFSNLVHEEVFSSKPEKSAVGDKPASRAAVNASAPSSRLQTMQTSPGGHASGLQDQAKKCKVAGTFLMGISSFNQFDSRYEQKSFVLTLKKFEL